MEEPKDKTEKLDTQYEIEKKEIDVPEQTVSAAVKKARAYIAALGNAKSLTASGREKIARFLGEEVGDDPKAVVARLEAYCKKAGGDIVDRNDIQRNLMNITLPNRSDKSLKTQIDWNRVKDLGLHKMTRLGDMTVEQLKALLMAIRGNR